MFSFDLFATDEYRNNHRFVMNGKHHNMPITDICGCFCDYFVVDSSIVNRQHGEPKFVDIVDILTAATRIDTTAALSPNR